MSNRKAVGVSPHVADTRRWQRRPVDVPIRVIVGDQLKATIVVGRSTCLSEGGMAMFAGAELKPGDQVAVEFTPPYSAPPIRVDARVCNRTGYNYGVEFITASQSQQRQASELKRHLSSMAGLAEE